MLRGLFITGTDTNVGKTAVAAALIHRYRRAVPLRYWKPIQTGIETEDDTAAVRRLTGCGEHDVFACGARLRRPVSPHLAARLSGEPLHLQPLIDLIEGQSQSASWIVEGAGGTLVPLNDAELMIDLMVRLELPVVIAARTTLGTINHTLLTLEAVRRRALRIAGVVMVGPCDPDNRAAIEAYGGVSVLGEMPLFEPLSCEQLAAWSQRDLDPESRLLSLLQ